MLSLLIEQNLVFSFQIWFTDVSARGQPQVICFLPELSLAVNVLIRISALQSFESCLNNHSIFFSSAHGRQIHQQHRSIPNSPSFKAEECRCCFATSTSNSAVNSTQETDCKSVKLTCTVNGSQKEQDCSVSVC